MSSLIRRLFISVFLFIGVQGFAVEPEHLGGPIHEAFVTPIQGAVIYEAIAEAPPQRITERIPNRPGDEEEWIPGYWAWDKKKADFVWVCGVWRKPPPGTLWNPGYWNQLDEGWVWIPGFWHNQPAQNLHYIKKPPPATVNENIGNPPRKDMFWASGFWDYNRARNSYQWRGGKWETMDQKWVFTPATYTWRPDGYIFVPAYWDWPLDDRGSAYCTIFLQPNQRSGIVHTPSVILEPEVIIRTLFVYWPDYIIFFHHWWHFHPGFWGDWCCMPPWWGWGGGWWGFDWFSAWNLWWWWGNPGFPFPWWMAAALAGMIPPPGAGVFPLMGDASPPPIIGPNGMLPPNDLIEAIGGDQPILPADPQDREDIEDQVKPPTSDQGDLRPNGPEGGTPPLPPEVDEGSINQGPAQTLPPIPETPSFRPPIQPVPTRPIQPTTPRPFYPPPQRQPRPEFETPRPTWPQPERPRPQWPRPQYRPPQQRPHWPRPEFRPPQQRPPSRPEFTPPQQTPPMRTPTHPPQTQPPSSSPQFRPPTHQMRPPTHQIRPEFRPQQMTPQFRPPQQTPQSVPQTEMY